MSPLPRQFIDRWQNRPESGPHEGKVYWHILLGGHTQARAAAKLAQERLSKFNGLHMTPPRWLHITTLISGTTNDITHDDMREMLTRARLSMSKVPRIKVSLEDVLYHPEAIVLKVKPDHALRPIFEVARSATQAVTGNDGALGAGFRSWTPHVTLCYSMQQQIAEPIISTLGRKVPRCEITIEALSLVVQHGPERLWDWRPFGEARLLGKP